MPSDRNLEEARSAIFSAANERVHRVEDQWHYKYLHAAGFVPVTKSATGLVRSYQYKHSDGRTVTCSTGVNADYWNSSDGQGGYWSALEKYCEQ